jgi:hypothetical protein
MIDGWTKRQTKGRGGGVEGKEKILAVLLFLGSGEFAGLL